jgi:phospho-N-acetylmuramoyl-pentapeptide-transferase
MQSLLGFFLFSFTINAALIVPFIDWLYTHKWERPKEPTADLMGKINSVFNRLHQKKSGTPVGGGLLIILTTTILFMLVTISLILVGAEITSLYPLKSEMIVIFATFIFFGLLGLYDDIVKFFGNSYKQVGITAKTKLIFQLVLGLGIGWYLHSILGITILNIPFFGVIDLGWLYIPFAAFVITAFSNAVNITDGLDGLAAGVLMIALFAIIVISASVLDTPIALFISLWLGGLLAFLYFNTHPARIFLGDVGALSFGATLAVIALLLGKVVAIAIISSVFIVELLTSGIQIFGKRYLGRKLLPIAPFHLWLQSLGWEESKIVTRTWLAAIIMAVFGLWLAVL